MEEATFNRDGELSFHNSREWQRNNSLVIHGHGYQHRYSVNVWAGIVYNQIIGLCILPTYLTGKEYLQSVLKDVFPRFLENAPLGIRGKMWFQHDGATAHFIST